MSITNVYYLVVPAGVTRYYSATAENKINELKASGDLISKNIEDMGNNKYKITYVWKDQQTFDSFLNWLNSSGEQSLASAYNSANNILTKSVNCQL